MTLLTKAQAAGLLGSSEKTVDRLVTRGQLPIVGHEKPASGGKPGPLFERKDVERLRDARAAQQVLPAIIPERTDGQTALTTRGVQAPLVKLLGEALQQQVPLSDKLTLSLDEASKLSGVPVSVLRQARKDGTLPAVKLGRGWRVWQADLATFVESLRPQAPKTKRR